MTIQVCNDRSLASITSLPSGVSGSSLVLLETQTVSSSSTVSFTSNIDSTYKEYVFKFIDIHMATSDSNGTDNDMSASGTLHLFDPSSTTFVKHFTSDCHVYHKDDYSQRLLVAGYANVTAAIDGVQFGSSSGNIDAGTIKMYGVV
jgi:hypothetical protein